MPINPQILAFLAQAAQGDPNRMAATLARAGAEPPPGGPSQGAFPAPVGGPGVRGLAAQPLSGPPTPQAPSLPGNAGLSIPQGAGTGLPPRAAPGALATPQSLAGSVPVVRPPIPVAPAQATAPTAGPAQVPFPVPRPSGVGPIGAAPPGAGGTQGGTQAPPLGAVQAPPPPQALPAVAPTRGAIDATTLNILMQALGGAGVAQAPGQTLGSLLGRFG